MIYFVGAGVCLAILQRKDLRTLLNVRFHWPWLLLGSFLVQLFLWGISVTGHAVPQWIFEVTLVGVLVGLWTNRQIPGIFILFVGACLNFMAVVTHGGLMPVSLSAWRDAGHTVEQLQDSRHVIATYGGTDWLGDWIPLFRYVMSPGDVVAGVGIVMFLHRNTRKRDAA